MENSLINLGKLSKPLSKLVDVVGVGIGTLYGPFGTVIQAKADAKAKIIIAKSDNEVADLNYRAKCRIEYQESVRQYNIEQIAVHAANALPEKVSDEAVNKDWIFHFFQSAQNVCDEDMHILWGRILAGETKKPGSYHKRTIQFLRSLEKWEAEMFTKYCAFLLSFEDRWPFIIATEGVKKLISEKCDGVEPTSHFISIGLLTGDIALLPPSQLIGKKIFYFDQEYVLTGSPKKGKIEIGPKLHLLTLIGRQLSQIAGQDSCDDLIQVILDDIEKRDKIKLIKVQN